MVLDPGDGTSVALNVPLTRLAVMLVMTTEPLAPAPMDDHMFESEFVTFVTLS